MSAERLAHLLARYDLDAPYEGDEQPPPMSLEDFREMLALEHAGDCTGLPAPCPRCFAEYWMKAAEWAIAQGDAS